MIVKFVGGIRYFVGIKEIEVNFDTLENILEQAGEKIGKKIKLIIDKENMKTFLVIDDNGKEMKTSVVVHNNGKNILKQENIEDGELQIIMPVGGG
ncbi:hypothetical protein JYK00_06190 [Thermosipho ferrireducens]|uniref:MoaD/ThiS family protein n=1 Tax=Thermosipho ferrireducens TaxID=2571116 RepID=A0ABX7S643_9BACT|nr:hypothetical protein [Thermosipho ferrireducens]QTA37328.1 hypothetical protein JYK00_06190 [Thermosipho ferrireducens]